MTSRIQGITIGHYKVETRPEAVMSPAFYILMLKDKIGKINQNIF